MNGEFKLSEKKSVQRNQLSNTGLSPEKFIQQSPTSGVGSKEATHLSFNDYINESKKNVPYPPALLKTKHFLPSQSNNIFFATTVRPRSTTFHAKYGLKPPSHLEMMFQEHVDPDNFKSRTTLSPFDSLIKVPQALRLNNDFVDTRSQILEKENEKKILSIEVPPVILTQNSNKEVSSNDGSVKNILHELNKENQLLNTLVRTLLVKQVNSNQKHSLNQDENFNFFLKAFKKDPSIITRIQGLRNLQTH